MHAALPDVVSDSVIDACRRLGLKYPEQFFCLAAADAGFTNPQDVARCRHTQWVKQGYNALPPYIKDFCLRACNGEVSREEVIKSH